MTLHAGASLLVTFVDGNGGQPFPGASATLLWDTDGFMMNARIGEVSALAHIVAGADGTALIEDAPAGDILVLDARAEGTLAGPQRGTSQGCVLVAGHRATLRIPLYRGGYVTGTVVDERGRPVVDARVSARSFDDPRNVHNPFSWDLPTLIATTDESGTYRLGPIPPGRNAIVATSDLHESPPSIEDGSFPRAFKDHPEGMRVLVVAGSEVRRNLVLRSRPLAAVAGVVEDDRGRPLEGMRIVGAVGKVAPTDIEGRFRVIVPAESEVHLAVLLSPHDSVECEPMTLTSGEVREGVRIVAPSARVISGSVRTRDDAPLAGVRVAPVRHDDVPEKAPPGGTISDAGGRFQLEVFSTEPLRIGFWANGFDVEVMETPALKEPGSTVQMECVLFPNAPPRLQQGIVLDDGGRPLEGARVTAAPLGTARWVEGFTAADGSYRLEGVDEGELEVEVRTAGFLPAREILEETGLPHQWTLLKEIRLTGVLVDAAGGPPPAGVNVVATCREKTGNTRSFATRSGADGSFSLGGFAPGRCVLEVAHPVPFEATSRWIPVRLNDVEIGGPRLTIALRAGLSIQGRVLTPGGEAPPVQCTVAAFAMGRSDFAGPLYAPCSPDGTFLFEGLDAARYVLRLQAESHPHSDEVWLEAGQQQVDAGAKDVVLELVRGGVLEGRLLDESGAPIDETGQVIAVSDDGEKSVFGVMKPGGRFRAPQLDATKRWTLVFHGFPGGRAAISGGHEVGTGNLELKLIEGKVLEGRVFDEARQPAAAVPITVKPTVSGRLINLSVPGTHTNGEGRFRIEGLPALPVQVLAGSQRGDLGAQEWSEVATPEPVMAGETNVVLHISRLFRLQGRLRTAAGTDPPRGWIVKFVARGATRSTDVAIPDAQGRFQLVGLPAGPGVVQAIHGERSENLAEVEIPMVGEPEFRLEP
jgi:hypothetical protein